MSDGLSDLTDCHRPDGRYDQRSEVKEAIKKSQLIFSSLALSSATLPPTLLDSRLRQAVYIL